jgi:long-chain acyl-CoA synthetase
MLRCLRLNIAVRAVAVARASRTHIPLFSRGFQTLVELQQFACSRFAERPFLGWRVAGQSTFEWSSYKSISEDILRAKSMLQQAGVVKDSVVAIIANNRKEWVIAAYATFSLGARFVPMYEAMPPKDWVYILNDCKASVLFAAKVVADKAPDVQKQVASIRSVVFLDAPATSPDSFESALARGAAASNTTLPTTAAVVSPSDIATIIYTSGTTGKPKGVCLSHDNIVSNVEAIASLLKEDQYSSIDRHSSFLPWAHIYGTVLCFLLHANNWTTHTESPASNTLLAGQTVELHHTASRGASLGLTSSVTLLEDLPLISPSVLISVITL